MKPTTTLTLALATLLLATSTGTTFAADDEVSRVSETRFYAREGREQAQPDRVSTDEYSASQQGLRSAATQGAATFKSKDRSLATVGAGSANIDVWVYSADVELFADDDRDGYYHGIDLLFDVDTVFVRAEVYAVVYLSLDGGPWMEYAETEDFVIHGTSSNDDFTVVTELLSGYPAGDYDVLIEIFDTFDNRFIADAGPADSAALSYLPLEDAGRDAPVVEPRAVVVNTTGGGGAVDLRMLVVLALLTFGAAVMRGRRVPVAGGRS